MDDYLLLLTATGGFLPFLFMVAFAAFKFHEPSPNIENSTETRTLLGVLAACNVASVLTQSFALLHAHSYKRVQFSYSPIESVGDHEDSRSNYTKLRSSARIGQWLIFLLILNLALWVVGSTFELGVGIRTTYFVPSVYWSEKVWKFAYTHDRRTRKLARDVMWL